MQREPIRTQPRLRPVPTRRRRRHAAGIASALGLGLLLAAGCQPQREAETVERSYELHCVGCHGKYGEGAWGSNIQGLKSSVEEIAAVIANGAEKMPAYKGHLSETEITEMAEYVKAFKMGAEQRPAQ